MTGKLVMEGMEDGNQTSQTQWTTKSLRTL